MTAARWERQDDGSHRCATHGEAFVMPVTCSQCATDRGIAPAQLLTPITFPPACKSDEQAWSDLTADADALGEDVTFYRRVRRRLYTRAKGSVTDADEPRAKGVVVLTDELLAQLATVANVIVKLQDARTKALRAIVESSGAHRRDQRTQQLLEQKLRDSREGRH